VQVDYTTIATRPIINFIAGSGITINGSDDAANNRVNVTINYSGFGMAPQAEPIYIQETVIPIQKTIILDGSNGFAIIFTANSEYVLSTARVFAVDDIDSSITFSLGVANKEIFKPDSLGYFDILPPFRQFDSRSIEVTPKKLKEGDILVLKYHYKGREKKRIILSLELMK
jgi:hypothetical protein